jgi:putative ABC transport system permease protein
MIRSSPKLLIAPSRSSMGASLERSKTMISGLSWRYAVRSLLRGRQRTLFAVACITMGVIAIVALQLVGNMVNAALNDDIRAINGGDLALQSDSGTLGQAQLDYIAQLQAQGTVTAYTSANVDNADFQLGSSLQDTGFFAVDPARYPLAGSQDIVTPSGSSLPALLQDNGVVVTDSMMARTGVRIGDRLSITTGSGRTGTVTVSGEIIAFGPMIGRAEMLLSQQTYASLGSPTGAPVSYGWIWMDVPGHSAAAATTLAAQLKQRYPLVNTITLTQTQQQVKSEVDGIRTFLRIIGLLALLIGGVGIINTMQVLLRRRLLEIAMLKTMGYRQRDLLRMFGVEAGVLGVTGGIIGAVAGIGVSLLVKTLVARAFTLELPTVIDPFTVLSGVVVGIAATLIFGLLPIVQNSAVRPIMVLREMPGQSRRFTFGALGLLLLLFAGFFVLALGILGNAGVTIAVVAGAGVLSVLLMGIFSAVAWLISLLPIPRTFAPWYALLLLLPLLAALELRRLSLGFTVLLVVLAILGLVAGMLPRPAKAEVRLALRNIGRARARSATTLLALFIGVFAVGLGLSAGQALRAFIAQRSATVNQDNAYVIAAGSDVATASQQIALLPNVTHEQITLATPDRIIAVNGKPIASINPTANVDQALSGLDGFDLANGQLPPVVLEQGAQDDHEGRLLTTADAGTANALLPVGDSQAPFNLKLGDALKVSSIDGKRTATLQVAGFYTGLGTFGGFATVIVDKQIVTQIGKGSVATIFALNLPANQEQEDLRQIKQNVPGVVTLGAAAAASRFGDILNNIVQAVESIALLVLVAGLILVANAVALAMLERRREMGILKAIGHTSRSVMSMVLVENGMLGFVGAFLALALVALITAALGRLAFQAKHASDMDPMLMLGLVAATAVVCMGVAAGVAWGATRVRPLEVLRYE